jgi:hypothetical protein
MGLVAATVMLLATQIPAMAQGNVPPDVTNLNRNSSATVGTAGAGATMYIECAWEVVDTSPLTAAFTYDGSITDDDNTSQDQTLSDGVTTAGAPCVPDTSQAPANMVNFKRHSIQLHPNADDADTSGTPGTLKRQYQKWVAVESTSISQIGDVFWKVWEPYVANPPYNNSPDTPANVGGGSIANFGPNCGALSPTNSASPIEVFATDPTTDNLNTRQYCLKYQHHATADLTAVSGTNPLVQTRCADLQTSGAGNMFQQAINEGEMTAAERDAIINTCFQNEKAIFFVTENVSKDQPCGEYRIETTVVNTSGIDTKRVNFFDVLCFVYLKTDFTTVDWGTIQNNADANRSGNMTFDTADGQPTIRNAGNAPLYLEVGFDPLVFQTDPTKNINQFDVALRAEWQANFGLLTVVNPIFARDAQQHKLWTCIGDQPIGPNQNGKIDFSVHPVNAQAGAYAGVVKLVARTTCAGAPRVAATNPNNPNANNVYYYTTGSQS